MPDPVSVHSATNQLAEKAFQNGHKTAFERYEKQVPQCSFGLNGSCCYSCNSGPCRVGNGNKGVCGADEDLIAARSFVRMVAAGQAAQLTHAWRFSKVLLDTAHGNTSYNLKGSKQNVIKIASRLGIKTNGKQKEKLVKQIASIFIEDLSRTNGDSQHVLNAFLPDSLINKWKELKLLPSSSTFELAQSVSRSSFGVEADPFELLLQAVRLSLTDGNDIFICALAHDILQGEFRPSIASAGLGVLNKNAVNIAVHGHVPLMPAVVSELAGLEELQTKAKEAGASEGLNVIGICCTGHEMLGRYGIPLAASVMQQELVITTGALDAYVVDQQCVFPSLSDLAQCFHTALITSDPYAHLPGAIRIEMDDKNAYEQGKKIIERAIEAFKKRNQEKIFIPEERTRAMGIFTTSAILNALGGTVKPLVDAVAAGKIRGIAVVGTCNNPKVKNDLNNVTILRELIKNNVLTISTGCAAHAAAKAGLLDPEEGPKFAGNGLSEVVRSLGVPPVLHAGACIYNSQLLSLAGEIAEYLKVQISDLPLAVSAPEWVSFKAVSQGTFLVASGVLVHVGVVPPVTGSKKVVQILTSDISKILGGRLYVEPDPLKAVEGILSHIDEKRKNLGI